MANKEPSYPHFFHAMSPTEISAVKVTGDVEIGYIGFGSKGSITQSITYFFCKIYLLLDLQPAPPVGFNLTFVCPEGEVLRTFCERLKNSTQVFNHDWFATPFVLTTCQPNGVFDPPDWEIFDCVIREYD